VKTPFGIVNELFALTRDIAVEVARMARAMAQLDEQLADCDSSMGRLARASDRTAIMLPGLAAAGDLRHS
jgi:hypothetical protein